MFQVVNVDAAFAEAFVIHQIAVQRDVGFDPVDHDFVQRVTHASHGFVTRRPPSDQLADQGVVVGRNLVAAVQVRIDANAVAARCVEVLDHAWARHERCRVFSVDPAFQRVTVNVHVSLGEGQLVACRNAQHLFNDVDAGDHFGHRVLYLHTSVHLDEVETTIFVQELESTRTTVVDVNACLNAACQNFLASLLVDARCWRFFQNLLVTTLQRAIAVAQVDRVTLAVGNNLDFHVTWVGQVFFQVDHRVAEPGAGFFAGLLGGFDQVFFTVHNAHATTTTAASGFDDHRVADFTANAQCGFRVFRQRAVRAWNSRYARRDHGVLGRYLVAHQANGVSFRADEGKAGFLDLFGEIGVFSQEAVARVNRRGARHFGCRDDRRDMQIRQVGWCRTNADGFVCQTQVHQFLVGSGVHRDGLDAQFLARPQDAQGDLAAVGDQDFFQLLRLQHRWLPVVQTMVNSGWSNSTG